MRKLLATLSVVALLAGCANQATTNGPVVATPPNAVQQAQINLSKFTMADLQAADQDAVAHNDRVAHLCYSYLATQLGKLPSGSTVAGVVSAFQKTRDLQNQINGGISQDFQINCAPLLSDVQANLVKLGLIGAGTAAGVTVAPGLIPMVP